MKRIDNFSKYLDFREKFKYFSYEGFSWKLAEDILILEYDFNLSGKFNFRPQVKIPFKADIYRAADKLNSELIDRLVFHIGLIEMISYWKAACPKMVMIKAGKLNTGQLDFWKKIYFQGLGEFFYLNSIPATIHDFMEIRVESADTDPMHIDLSGRALVPVGGGKDSAVTMELIRKNGVDCIPMAVNPGKASLDVIHEAGCTSERIAMVNREIHPALLNLNKIGFLNGHTPFSALLAFYSLLIAYLAGCRDIILSNESSASEATVPGTEINHQYSKSFEFEKDFRDYTARYLSPDFNYFSLLRPISELQIGKLFSGLEKFHPIFLSCNVGSKTGHWCGKCPKCLFTWIILSPFLSVDGLKSIFNKDLFEDESLAGILDELTGISEVKPFECIGTVDEVNLALELALRKYPGHDLPALLQHYKQVKQPSTANPEKIGRILAEINKEHFVPEKYLNLLIRALNE